MGIITQSYFPVQRDPFIVTVCFLEKIEKGKHFCILRAQFMKLAALLNMLHDKINVLNFSF